jgi:hypothetical protein
MTVGSSSKVNNTVRSKPVTSDDHPHSTAKWIGCNPPLVWLFDVLAAGLDSRFNPLAGCGRDALAIENEKA